MVFIDRANRHIECSALIGQLNVKLSDGRVERIAIHCTKPKIHKDACEFVGVDLVIMRRRRLETF